MSYGAASTKHVPPPPPHPPYFSPSFVSYLHGDFLDGFAEVILLQSPEARPHALVGVADLVRFIQLQILQLLAAHELPQQTLLQHQKTQCWAVKSLKKHFCNTRRLSAEQWNPWRNTSATPEDSVQSSETPEERLSCWETIPCFGPLFENLCFIFPYKFALTKDHP